MSRWDTHAHTLRTGRLQFHNALLEYQAEPVGQPPGRSGSSRTNWPTPWKSDWRRGADPASLRPFVPAREKDDESGPVRGVETEFAKAVGDGVLLEVLGRLEGPSGLSTLADETHLALAPLSAGQLR